MSKTQERQAKLKERKKEKLAWAIREWDCQTLQEVIAKARTDPKLHLILRECGIKLEKITHEQPIKRNSSYQARTRIR